LYKTFTDEQNEIIYSDSPFIYVNAKAGTGKTTTLVEFAKVRRYDSFLYLVYNSENRKSAEGKFSPNVIIHTIHSVAFEELGYLYKDRLVNNLKVEHVFSTLSYFDNKSIHNSEEYNIAYEVLQGLSDYCNSRDFEIEHVNSDIKKLIIEYWNILIAKDSKSLISHDVYLKLYYLSKPKLEFDYIVVDEAQDLNQVAEAIIDLQKTNKVFIGDVDQKIYGFRGAINIFNKEVKNSVSFSLSQSFRFGPEVATIANKVLINFKDKDILNVVGTESIDSKINTFDYNEQYTLISRTNATLIDNAIKLVKEGRKIHIVGGFENIKEQALDIYYLYKNKKSLIKNDFLKKMKNFYHLSILSERTNNAEYNLLINFIERYGDFLEEYIELIDKNNTSMKLADVVLTTAHKSKGLEFYNVILCDDFAELFKGDNIVKNVDEEEINLIYVAVTRSIENLILNKDLNKLNSLPL